MTALNFLLEPDRVCIATDTLALSLGGRSHKFATKIFPLPHLQLIICGTGLLQLATDWYLFVQTSAVVRSIIGLNKFAPAILRELWARHPEASGTSGTIYHFGFDEEAGYFRGFAFRSSNDFEEEELQQNAFGVKPPVLMPEIKTLPDGFIELVSRQREEDLRRPVQERIGVGGEVQFAILTQNSVTITTCHRFDDFEEIWEEMLANLKDPTGNSPNPVAPADA
jgi:hypothetical protein